MFPDPRFLFFVPFPKRHLRAAAPSAAPLLRPPDLSLGFGQNPRPPLCRVNCPGRRSLFWLRSKSPTVSSSGKLSRPPFPPFGSGQNPRPSLCRVNFPGCRSLLWSRSKSATVPSDPPEYGLRCPLDVFSAGFSSCWNSVFWSVRYVTKLLNIFNIFINYLHNSKSALIFAVKF